MARCSLQNLVKECFVILPGFQDLRHDDDARFAIHTEEVSRKVRPLAVHDHPRHDGKIHFPVAFAETRPFPDALQPDLVDRQGKRGLGDKGFDFQPAVFPGQPGRAGNGDPGKDQILFRGDQQVRIRLDAGRNDPGLFQDGRQESHLPALEKPGRVVGAVTPEEGPGAPASEFQAQISNDLQILLLELLPVRQVEQQAVLEHHELRCRWVELPALHLSVNVQPLLPQVGRQAEDLAGHPQDAAMGHFRVFRIHDPKGLAVSHPPPARLLPELIRRPVERQPFLPKRLWD